MMDSQSDVANGRQRRTPTHTHPSTPIQQDFLFVDASKAKSSRQGRRNARSFVMQKARRERPWSTSKHAAKKRNSPDGGTSPGTVETPDLSHTPISSTPSPPVANEIPLQASSENRSSTVVKQELCPDCQIFLCRPGQTLCPRCLCLQPSPAEEPDNSLFDPFGTVSVESDGTTSELLEHFVTEMAPGIIAVDIRHKSTLMKSDWFDTAVSNAGFMHSLLSTAALHLYISGRGSIDTILHHRAQAIAAVNSAISDPDPNKGISDANIGAVFNLLSVEEGLQLSLFDQEQLREENQPNQRAIHLNGLRRMVELRGGLMAMKSNRILQAFILWHSTVHAIARFEAPNPTAMSDISAAHLPRHYPPGYRPNISNHLLEYCRSVQVKPTLTDLVESVLILIADLNAWFNDAHSPLDPLDMQNHACVLECALLRWLRDHENTARPLESALCIALLIFTIRTTEAMKRRADIHTLHFAASKRLECALSYTERSEWQACPDLLLWILAIAAISAEGSAASPWFTHQASLACAEFGVCDASTLLQRLHRCGWVSFKLDEAAALLWERIVSLRLEPAYFDHQNLRLRHNEDDDDDNIAPDAPVGPLQFRVPEELGGGGGAGVEWQDINWAALSSLGVPESSCSTSSGIAGLGALSLMNRDEGLFGLEASYGLPTPQQPFFDGISWRHPNPSQ